MPHPNFKTLSIREDVYRKLARMAEERGTSASKLLGLLLENIPVNVQGEANQNLCGEKSVKPQNMAVSSLEAESDAEDKNYLEGIGEDGKYFQWPFRNLVYQNKSQPAIENGYCRPSTGKVDCDDVELSEKDRQKLELILTIIQGLRELRRRFG